MSSEPITPDTLLPEIVAQLNIVIDWARQTKDVERLGEQAEDLCVHYRAYAICLFAAQANVDLFFHWLLHSPILRRHFLRMARAQGVTASDHLRATFLDPVLDAIAARQWKLAADIGAGTSPEWMRDAEYEDDYCYADLIRRLVEPRTDGVEQLMARWRASLEGGNDLRLDVAEALLAGDGEVFLARLRALLKHVDAKAQQMVNPGTLSPLADELPFFPNRWISVEGLALLALAERRGIAIDEDIEGCPRLLRPGRYAPFRPLAYPDLGLD